MSYGTRFPLKTGHGLGLSPAKDRWVGRQCDEHFAQAANGDVIVGSPDNAPAQVQETADNPGPDAKL